MQLVVVAILVAGIFGAEGKPENPVCPDGKSSCRVGQTCCAALGGKFGCCPYDYGICCSDMKSCCPKGMTCTVTAHGTGCTSSETKKPKAVKPTPKLSKPSPLKPAPVQLGYPVVGGNQTESLEENGSNGGTKYCPDGRTICATTVPCCFHAGGAYGCCPYPYGVCCADYVSCCPYGTRCNIQAHTCEII